jgi:hypothetical protein
MRNSWIALLVAVGILITGTTVLFYLNKKYYDPDHRQNIEQSTLLDSKTLSPFVAVIANPGSDVHIKQDPEFGIAIETDSANQYPPNLYTMRGDTLVVEKGARVFISCPSLNLLVVNQSYWTGVNHFSAPVLDIHMNGGKLTYNYSYQHSEVDTLRIQMNEGAWFGSNMLSVKVASLYLDQVSECSLGATVHNLHADVRDRSKLRTSVPLGKMSVEKDSSGRLEFINN